MNPAQALTLSLASPIEEIFFSTIASSRARRKGFRGFGSSWTDTNQTLLSLPTVQFLAILAYGEAASEGGEGLMAVLSVVRNRTANLSSFGDQEILSLTGDPYKAVGLKQYQFSLFNLNDPVRKTVDRIASNFDAEVNSNSNLRMAYDLADMLLQGQLDDNTGGADYYFNPSIVQPSWASSLTLMGQIGNHIFYKTPGSSYPEPIAYASLIPDLGTVDLSSMGVGNIPITTLILVGFGVGLLIMNINRR